MKTEFEKALAEEFPFMRYSLSPEEPGRTDCIGIPYESLGLDCGDGWYRLIRDMCREITAAYEAVDEPVDIVVDQVKEKYGTLRFYYHHTACPLDGRSPGAGPGGGEIHRKVEEIVDKYEEMSGNVCEVCGAPGELRTDLQWMLTLCDEHYRKRGAPHGP